jgi:hypothetical protein
MSRRNDEVVSALLTRDIIIPDSSRDKKVVAHIENITDKIRNSYVDCIDSYSIRPLIRVNSKQGTNMALIYEEIFQQIMRDSGEFGRQQYMKDKYGFAYKAGVLLPFGSIYPDLSNIKRDYYGSETNLGLGKDTVAAYAKWRKKRSAYTNYAFCFDRVYNLHFLPSRFGPEFGSSIVKTALQKIKVKPNFVSTIDIQSWNYLSLGFYFDRIPPLFEIDTPEEYVSEQIDHFSQFRIFVDITKVEMLPDVPLAFIYAKYLRDEIVKIRVDRGIPPKRIIE